MTSEDVVNQVQFFTPKPYFPHRGSPEKRAQPTQGKLFQEPKPSTLARYPRGYTPERMSEVREKTGWLINAPGGSSFSLTGSSLDSPYNVPHGARLAQEAIARSDVPMKHLENLGRISLRSGLRGTGFGLEDRLGSYTPASRAIDIEPMRGDLSSRRGLITSKEQLRKNRGISRPEAENMYGSALIHEIGHHVDFTRRRMAGQQERSRRFLSTPTGRGKAEGEADRYMLQRFRPDPRTKGATAETQTYGAMGLLYKGYPQDLARRGKAAAETASAAGEARERRNINR